MERAIADSLLDHEGGHSSRNHSQHLWGERASRSVLIEPGKLRGLLPHLAGDWPPPSKRMRRKVGGSSYGC
jgi:hypothetical protein